MRLIDTLLLLLACLPTLHAQDTCAMTHRFSIRNKGCQLTKLISVLPVPQTNAYQEITGYESSSGEVSRAKGNRNNAYLMDCREEQLPAPGSSYTLSQSYEARLYPMHIDMEQFRQLHAYDRGSRLYKRYTASDGVYIDVEHPLIKTLADRLWQEAKGHVLDYARACYLYVARHFSYKSPHTNIHAIADILRQKGGNCGNLSSVFVNLLRARGIPAKHIVTVRPDGTYHIWADFYLEEYGWIPADVTLKHEHPSGDYFGHYAGDGVIVSEDTCSLLEFGEDEEDFNAVLLHTYCYWYWNEGNKGKLEPAISISGKRISQPSAPRVASLQPRSASIEWTPFKGATGYRLVVTEQKSGEIVQTLELGRHARAQELTTLTPATAYRIHLIPLRRVDNIMTTMGSYALKLQTPPGA